MTQTSAIRRLLIRASAIRAANPCPGRWYAYKAANLGPVHPLAALLLPRPDTTDFDARGDFLWVLKHVAACPAMTDLQRRLQRAYREALLVEYPNNTYAQVNPLHYWYADIDFPNEWDRIARDVIRRMERGQSEARGSRA